MLYIFIIVTTEYAYIIQYSITCMNTCSNILEYKSVYMHSVFLTVSYANLCLL